MQARRATASQVVLWCGLVAAVLWLSLRGWGSFQLGVYQDDAAYVVLARSLALGGPYGLIDRPGAPAPKFGFGFPLLLSGIARCFPRAMEGLGAVSLAATLLNVGLLFWGWPLLSPTTSRWLGLAVASLYGLSPLTVGGARMVMSEPAFTSLVLVALLLTERSCGGRRSDRWTPVALGAVVAFAVFTRTIGAALAGAVLLRLVCANRARLLPLIALGGIGMIGVVLVATPIEARHLVPREYLHELQDGAQTRASPARNEGVFGRIGRVSGGYVGQEIRRAVVAFGSGEREQALASRLGLPWNPAIGGVLISAVVALGTWRGLSTRAVCGAVLLFEALYAGVLLVWPWSSVRFLYPLQPFLCMQFLLGVGWLWARATQRRSAPAASARARDAAMAAASAVLIAVSAWKSLAIEDSRRFTRDLGVGTAWLATNSAANAVVMARYPESVSLYSERAAVDVEPVASPEAFARLLDQRRVDFLLVAPSLRWNAGGAIDYDDFDEHLMALASALAARGQLDLVYRSDPLQKVLIFRVNRASSTLDP